MWGPANKKIGQIQKLLQEQEPERQEIQRAIKELDRLVNPASEDMDPPKSQFRSILEDCREILAGRPTDAELQSFQNRLAKIEKKGNDAYGTKNHREWANVNDTLMQLYSRIQKLTGGGGDNGGGTEPEPLTWELKKSAGHQIDGYRSSLDAKREECLAAPEYETKYKPRCDRVAKLIDQMESDIDKIDEELSSKQALAKIRQAMRLIPAVEDGLRNIIVDVGK